LTDRFNKANRENWEQTRFISYIIAQTQAYKKKYKITDIIRFPWDEESKEITGNFEDVLEKAKLFQQKIEQSKNNKPRIAKFN